MIAICTIIKNENLFLKEWIDWHLKLGFDAIHIFEDKGSDSHKDIVNDYSNVYLHNCEENYDVHEILSLQGQSHRQVLLYDYFAKKYVNEYDRVAFIDLDEFICFDEKYNLEKLCEEFEPYPAVLLNWKMMGASGHINKPQCGVMDAYTKPCDFSNTDSRWAYKSFVNLKRYKGLIDLHKAVEYVNTHHENDCHKYYYDKAWLNHYFTKSWEDWCDRIFNRGGTQNGHRTLVEFFEANKDMCYLKETLISLVQEKKPKGTCWLDKHTKKSFGGNVQKIMDLNGTPIVPIFNKKELTNEEALNMAIVDAMKLGLNKGCVDKSKLVHFCWFGKSKLPELATKCISSWKKFLPNHTFCLWTENSFDVSTNAFTQGAYDKKSFAFVSDYVRFWAVYNYGGVYFDTDVELINSIDDIPNNFLCYEKGFRTIGIGLGFGADKGNEIIKKAIEFYNNKEYNKEHKKDFIVTSIFTEILMKEGYEINTNEVHKFKDFTIYPHEYFCPRSFTDSNIEKTENTRAIHHYSWSWK